MLNEESICFTVKFCNLLYYIDVYSTLLTTPGLGVGTSVAAVQNDMSVFWVLNWPWSNTASISSLSKAHIAEAGNPFLSRQKTILETLKGKNFKTL